MKSQIKSIEQIKADLLSCQSLAQVEAALMTWYHQSHLKPASKCWRIRDYNTVRTMVQAQPSDPFNGIGIYTTQEENF